MIQTKKYVKKPLYVQAVQITKENFEEIAEWCQGEIKNENASNPQHRYIYIQTHNPNNARQSQAIVGDWILHTDRGYKIYTPMAFEGSFELVPVAQVEMELSQ